VATYYPLTEFRALIQTKSANEIQLVMTLIIMKVREAIKLIEDDGWYLDRTRGSHRQYKHPQKRGLVTIAGKPGDDLAPGTKNSILKQAGLK
jgi:predicted RNA binding protein YcfA (HicA-like mRNA interferase family)